MQVLKGLLSAILGDTTIKVVLSYDEATTLYGLLSAMMQCGEEMNDCIPCHDTVNVIAGKIKNEIMATLKEIK